MRRAVTGGFAVALLGALGALAVWSGGAGAGERPMSYEIDTGESWVVAVTETAGALGFLGHRHSVLVTDWTAEVDWRPEELDASRATVTVPTAALRIDTERGRELAGLDDGPSDDDVAEIQEKMLGPENLVAAEYPEIRFEVTGVESGRDGDLEVEGRLSLRGRSRTVRFPVAVEEARGGGAVFTGSFTVEQTDFGIEPESIAGVVKVADPVEVRFRVVVRR